MLCWAFCFSLVMSNFDKTIKLNVEIRQNILYKSSLRIHELFEAKKDCHQKVKSD